MHPSTSFNVINTVSSTSLIISSIEPSDTTFHSRNSLTQNESLIASNSSNKLINNSDIISDTHINNSDKMNNQNNSKKNEVVKSLDTNIPSLENKNTSNISISSNNHNSIIHDIEATNGQSFTIPHVTKQPSISSLLLNSNNNYKISVNPSQNNNLNINNPVLTTTQPERSASVNSCNCSIGKPLNHNKSNKSIKSSKTNKSIRANKSCKSNKSNRSIKANNSNKSNKSIKANNFDKSNRSINANNSNESNKPNKSHTLNLPSNISKRKISMKKRHVSFTVLTDLLNSKKLTPKPASLSAESAISGESYGKLLLNSIKKRKSKIDLLSSITDKLKDQNVKKNADFLSSVTSELKGQKIKKKKSYIQILRQNIIGIGVENNYCHKNNENSEDANSNMNHKESLKHKKSKIMEKLGFNNKKKISKNSDELQNQTCPKRRNSEYRVSLSQKPSGNYTEDDNNIDNPFYSFSEDVFNSLSKVESFSFPNHASFSIPSPYRQSQIIPSRTSSHSINFNPSTFILQTISSSKTDQLNSNTLQSISKNTPSLKNSDLNDVGIDQQSCIPDIVLENEVIDINQFNPDVAYTKDTLNRDEIHGSDSNLNPMTQNTLSLNTGNSDDRLFSQDGFLKGNTNISAIEENSIDSFQHLEKHIYTHSLNNDVLNQVNNQNQTLKSHHSQSSSNPKRQYSSNSLNLRLQILRHRCSPQAFSSERNTQPILDSSYNNIKNLGEVRSSESLSQMNNNEKLKAILHKDSLSELHQENYYHYPNENNFITEGNSISFPVMQEGLSINKRNSFIGENEEGNEHDCSIQYNNSIESHCQSIYEKYRKLSHYNLKIKNCLDSDEPSHSSFKFIPQNASSLPVRLVPNSCDKDVSISISTTSSSSMDSMYLANSNEYGLNRSKSLRTFNDYDINRSKSLKTCNDYGLSHSKSLNNYTNYGLRHSKSLNIYTNFGLNHSLSQRTNSYDHYIYHSASLKKCNPHSNYINYDNINYSIPPQTKMIYTSQEMPIVIKPQTVISNSTSNTNSSFEKLAIHNDASAYTQPPMLSHHASINYNRAKDFYCRVPIFRHQSVREDVYLSHRESDYYGFNYCQPPQEIEDEIDIEKINSDSGDVVNSLPPHSVLPTSELASHNSITNSNYINTAYEMPSLVIPKSKLTTSVSLASSSSSEEEDSDLDQFIKQENVTDVYRKEQESSCHQTIQRLIKPIADEFENVIPKFEEVRNELSCSIKSSSDSQGVMILDNHSIQKPSELNESVQISEGCLETLVSTSDIVLCESENLKNSSVHDNNNYQNVDNSDSEQEDSFIEIVPSTNKFIPINHYSIPEISPSDSKHHDLEAEIDVNAYSNLNVNTIYSNSRSSSFNSPPNVMSLDHEEDVFIDNSEKDKENNIVFNDNSLIMKSKTEKSTKYRSDQIYDETAAWKRLSFNSLSRLPQRSTCGIAENQDRLSLLAFNSLPRYNTVKKFRESFFSNNYRPFNAQSISTINHPYIPPPLSILNSDSNRFEEDLSFFLKLNDQFNTHCYCNGQEKERIKKYYNLCDILFGEDGLRRKNLDKIYNLLHNFNESPFISDEMPSLAVLRDFIISYAKDSCKNNSYSLSHLIMGSGRKRDSFSSDFPFYSFSSNCLNLETSYPSLTEPLTSWEKRKALIVLYLSLGEKILHQNNDSFYLARKRNIGKESDNGEYGNIFKFTSPVLSPEVMSRVWKYKEDLTVRSISIKRLSNINKRLFPGFIKNGEKKMLTNISSRIASIQTLFDESDDNKGLEQLPSNINRNDTFNTHNPALQHITSVKTLCNSAQSSKASLINDMMVFNKDRIPEFYMKKNLIKAHSLIGSPHIPIANDYRSISTFTNESVNRLVTPELVNSPSISLHSIPSQLDPPSFIDHLSYSSNTKPKFNKTEPWTDDLSEFQLFEKLSVSTKSDVSDNKFPLDSVVPYTKELNSIGFNNPAFIPSSSSSIVSSQEIEGDITDVDSLKIHSSAAGKQVHSVPSKSNLFKKSGSGSGSGSTYNSFTKFSIGHEIVKCSNHLTASLKTKIKNEKAKKILVKLYNESFKSSKSSNKSQELVEPEKEIVNSNQSDIPLMNDTVVTQPLNETNSLEKDTKINIIDLDKRDTDTTTELQPVHPRSTLKEFELFNKETELFKPKEYYPFIESGIPNPTVANVQSLNDRYLYPQKELDDYMVKNESMVPRSDAKLKEKRMRGPSITESTTTESVLGYDEMSSPSLSTINPYFDTNDISFDLSNYNSYILENVKDNMKENHETHRINDQEPEEELSSILNNESSIDINTNYNDFDGPLYSTPLICDDEQEEQESMNDTLPLEVPGTISPVKDVTNTPYYKSVNPNYFVSMNQCILKEVQGDDVVKGEIMQVKIEPSEIMLDEIEPSGIMQDEIKPSEIMLDEIEPSEIMQDEIEPSEIIPDEIEPSEIIPDEIQPSEIIPDEIQPSEIIPDEIQPSEIVQNEIVRNVKEQSKKERNNKKQNKEKTVLPMPDSNKKGAKTKLKNSLHTIIKMCSFKSLQFKNKKKAPHNSFVGVKFSESNFQTKNTSTPNETNALPELKVLLSSNMANLSMELIEKHRLKNKMSFQSIKNLAKDTKKKFQHQRSSQNLKTKLKKIDKLFVGKRKSLSDKELQDSSVVIHEENENTTIDEFLSSVIKSGNFLMYKDDEGELDNSHPILKDYDLTLSDYNSSSKEFSNDSINCYHKIALNNSRNNQSQLKTVQDVQAVHDVHNVKSIQGVQAVHDIHNVKSIQNVQAVHDVHNGKSIQDVHNVQDVQNTQDIYNVQDNVKEESKNKSKFKRVIDYEIKNEIKTDGDHHQISSSSSTRSVLGDESIDKLDAQHYNPDLSVFRYPPISPNMGDSTAPDLSDENNNSFIKQTSIIKNEGKDKKHEFLDMGLKKGDNEKDKNKIKVSNMFLEKDSFRKNKENILRNKGKQSEEDCIDESKMNTIMEFKEIEPILDTSYVSKSKIVKTPKKENDCSNILSVEITKKENDCSDILSVGTTKKENDCSIILSVNGIAFSNISTHKLEKKESNISLNKMLIDKSIINCHQKEKEKELLKKSSHITLGLSDSNHSIGDKFQDSFNSNSEISSLKALASDSSSDEIDYQESQYFNSRVKYIDDILNDTQKYIIPNQGLNHHQTSFSKMVKKFKSDFSLKKKAKKSFTFLKKKTSQPIIIDSPSLLTHDISLTTIPETTNDPQSSCNVNNTPNMASKTCGVIEKKGTRKSIISFIKPRTSFIKPKASFIKPKASFIKPKIKEKDMKAQSPIIPFILL